MCTLSHHKVKKGPLFGRGNLQHKRQTQNEDQGHVRNFCEAGKKKKKKDKPLNSQMGKIHKKTFHFQAHPSYQGISPVIDS